MFKPNTCPRCVASFLILCLALMSYGGTCSPANPTQPSLCTDTCGFAADGDCDDGGPGSLTTGCELGSDCTDCGSRIDADEAGIVLADEIIEALPDEDPQVATVVSGDEGPAGSLFGLLLEDDSQAYFIGSTTDGGVEISSVVIADEQGNLVLQQDFTESSSKVTFASGDAVEFIDNGTTQQVIYTLNATTPASVAVVNVDADGNATIDEDASRFEDEPNPDYDDGNGKTQITQRTSRLRARSWRVPMATCSEIGNDIFKYANWACDVKGFITDKVGELVIETGCFLTKQTFEALAGDQSDPKRFKVFTGFKVGLGIACEGLKFGVKLGTTATKLNPIDVACTLTELANDATQLATKKTIAEHVCEAITGESTGNENDNGALTDVDNGNDNSNDNGSLVDTDTGCGDDGISPFIVTYYTNTDLTGGCDPSKAEITLSGDSQARPIYNFGSISNVHSIEVYDDKSLVYGIAAFEPEAQFVSALNSPITHGDLSIPNTIPIAQLSSPSDLVADGGTHFVVIETTDISDNGLPVIATLFFKLRN